MRLVRLGRAGGVVLLLLGIGALYAAYRLYAALGPVDEHELWSPRGMMVALFLALFAIPFVVAGVKNLLSPSQKRSQMSIEELLAAARTRPRPFHLCARCRQLFAPADCLSGRCPECGSFEHCHPIESEADLLRVSEEVGRAA